MPRRALPSLVGQPALKRFPSPGRKADQGPEHHSVWVLLVIRLVPRVRKELHALASRKELADAHRLGDDEVVVHEENMPRHIFDERECILNREVVEDAVGQHAARAAPQRVRDEVRRGGDGLQNGLLLHDLQPPELTILLQPTGPLAPGQHQQQSTAVPPKVCLQRSHQIAELVVVADALHPAAAVKLGKLSEALGGLGNGQRRWHPGGRGALRAFAAGWACAFAAVPLLLHRRGTAERRQPPRLLLEQAISCPRSRYPHSIWPHPAPLPIVASLMPAFQPGWVRTVDPRYDEVDVSELLLQSPLVRFPACVWHQLRVPERRDLEQLCDPSPSESFAVVDLPLAIAFPR
mmetsp:Transcript_73606/g.239594  ORF Transcript_73606/g.239594 Transcript_73606/m.239594 type:complete len:349 (+) Transcript_73606:707-1753(+)